MKNESALIREMRIQVKIMEKSYRVLTERIKMLESNDPEREQYDIERQILWAKCDMLDNMIDKFAPKKRIPWKFKFRKIWKILWY